MAEAARDQDNTLSGLLKIKQQGDGDHGLPFTPTGEVSLSKATWERLDRQGNGVDLTLPKEGSTTDAPRNLVFGSRDQLQDKIGSRTTDIHFGRENRSDIRKAERLSSPISNVPQQRVDHVRPHDEGHKPNLKPQQFDGGKPLKEYLEHFKVVASLNRWSDTEKGLYLAASLSGPAQRILNRVDVYAHGGYDQLLLALQDRYAPNHQEELYRATLKNRRQGKEETLRTLAEEVEIAVEKAYPYADRATVEQLTTEHFLTAVWDRRVR